MCWCWNAARSGRRPVPTLTSAQMRTRPAARAAIIRWGLPCQTYRTTARLRGALGCPHPPFPHRSTPRRVYFTATASLDVDVIGDATIPRTGSARMQAVAVGTVAPATCSVSHPGQPAAPRLLAPALGLGSRAGNARLQLSREASTSCRCRKDSRLVVRASSGALGEERGEDQGSEGFDVRNRLEPMMAGLGGPGSQLGGGGGALLEKSKLEFKQTVQQTSPKLADGGGGGGIGNFINMGGGGGGDDGDDDDFFGGGGEEGDGDGEGWFRSATAELFDMGAIQAVLSEWGYTVSSLPMFFRASAELFFTGAFSSANMVRFLCRDNRPTLARWLYEHLPYSVSRGLVGRLIADPGLAQKVALDMALTAGTNVYWEARQRGEQFWRELDLVAINTASAAAAAGAMVYMLAPARVGTAARAPWQEMLASLPNNVFEAGSKTRSFTLGSRAMGFLSKAAELSAVGAVTGAAMSGLGSAAVQLRRRADPTFQPSVPVPEMSRAVAGMGAFMGLSANLRYNVLAGLDRYMFERAKVLGYYVASTALARGASAYVGQPSRLWSLGLPMTLPPEIPGYVYMGRGKYRRQQRQVAPAPTAAKVRASAAAAKKAPRRRPGDAAKGKGGRSRREDYPGSAPRAGPSGAVSGAAAAFA